MELFIQIMFGYWLLEAGCRLGMLALGDYGEKGRVSYFTHFHDSLSIVVTMVLAFWAFNLLWG